MNLFLSLFDIITYILFIFALTYYLATTLQWYNYSFLRILTKHHKSIWHFYYFVVPLLMYSALSMIYRGMLFYGYFYLMYLPILFIWYKSLDKKLVWTQRIKRLFAIVLLFTIISVCLSVLSTFDIIHTHIWAALPLIFGFLFANICEMLIFRIYAKRAYSKLQQLQNLKIIAITGSYGKTSIKNFIAQILQQQFNVYATPRSVNTYKGLVADINQNINATHEIYVAEAGARQVGDIKEIADLLQHHYAVIGKIGHAHIEYFRNIEATIKTKFEMLYSTRLLCAFVQNENNYPETILPQFAANMDKIVSYPPKIKDIESTLEKTSFSLELDSVFIPFTCKILGRFNIDNISVAIMIAKKLGMDIKALQTAVSKLTPIPHRLQRIDTPQKVIIDDSFNGNLEGMSEAIRLASLHDGRKVIVTPGLVEHDEVSNISLAQQIDKVFDLVIITGDLNAKVLDTHITTPQKIILKDKTRLEEVLMQHGMQNDLVLFANDAPNYI